MNLTVLISSSLLLTALLPLSSVSTFTVQAAETASKKNQSAMAAPEGNGAAPAEGKNAGSEKVVEDKLKTCLSRIPAGSSRGQRMLAEEGCRKDQERRSASHAAPGF